MEDGYRGGEGEDDVIVICGDGVLMAVEVMIVTLMVASSSS